MQTLHRFAGSVQQYIEQLTDPDCYRPGCCPQCHTKRPLTAHGFYTRTIIDTLSLASFPVRCHYFRCACKRTAPAAGVVLPYLRSIGGDRAVFIARLFHGQTLQRRHRAAPDALPARPVLGFAAFARRPSALCATLGCPDQPISDFFAIHRALAMLESTGWIAAHRFLFAGVRYHLLGAGLLQFRLPTAVAPQSPPPRRPPELPHTPFAWRREAFRRKLPSRRKTNSMDDKAEKIALFRYGLIAPCWKHCPAAELTRRSRSPPASKTFLIPAVARSRWTRCLSVPCAIAATVCPRCPLLKPLPGPARWPVPSL